MLGQGPLVPDGGVEGLACCVEVPVEPVEPVEPVVAAEAPEMPAAAPPVARAPATIVAPSILDMRIACPFFEVVGDAASHH